MSEINHDEAWGPMTSQTSSQLKPARRPLVSVLSSEPSNVLPDSDAHLETRISNEADDSRDGGTPFHVWIILAYFFVAFAAQLVLLIPQFVGFRVPLRIAPFGISLLLALLPPTRRAVGYRMHPAVSGAAIILIIIMFGLLNQFTDSFIAGLAQIGLTAAILSPLLWVGRLQIGPRGLGKIILCLWAFNACSAGVGVLQVMFPGHFKPATSSVVEGIEETGITYNIELADGTEMERPYGLTDQPGGAATAGLTAFVFGLGLLVSSKNIAMRVLYLAGMGLGLFIMYLSQVRFSIVMCGVAVVAFVGIMAARGEFARLTGALIALAVVVFLSTSAAFLIGGSQTRDRLFTLVDDDASTVYHNNRGVFLDYTFDYVLPSYPLGAGLGRYGMMALYFNKNNSSGSLWAEIQWTAWAYDGGWLMVIAYPATILTALWISFKIGRSGQYGPVGLWAAILTSYNISVVAVTFSYSYFLSQSGLEFWLLNAALFSAAQVYVRSQNPEVPKGFEVLPAPWRPEINTATPNTLATPVPRRRALQHRALPNVAATFDQSGLDQ